MITCVIITMPAPHYESMGNDQLLWTHIGEFETKYVNTQITTLSIKILRLHMPEECLEYNVDIENNM